MITIENTNTIENDGLNFTAALDIIDQFYQLSEVNMYAVICMCIDTLSSKYGEASTSIVERIQPVIAEVNEDMGSFIYQH